MKRRMMAAVTLVVLGSATSGVTLEVQAAQLIWAHMGNESPAYVELLQKYQKKSGNVVKMVFCESTNDLTNVMMDTPPDLISMNPRNMSEYVDMGIFRDMSVELGSNKGFLKDLIPSVLDAYSSGKKIYALPWSSQITAMSYNATLFKASGVQPPSAGWRYTGEYYAAMKKLTKDTNGDGKKDQYGLVGIPIADWMPVVYSFGAQIVSKDGKKFMFTGKEAVQSLDFIKKLHKEGLAQTIDWGQRQENDPFPFMDGKSGTIISNWRIPRSDVKFTLGMTVPPSGPKGSFTSVEAAGIGIFNKCKKRKEAADFAKYLVSKDAQLILFKKDGIMPTSLSALASREMADAKTSIDKSLVRALPKAKAASVNPALNRGWGINRGLGEYISGSVTATEFIAQIRERVEQAIANSTW